MEIKYILRYCLVASILASLLGCGDEVRVSKAELVGIWTTRTNSGIESLELRSDNMFVQVFSSPTRQFTKRGTWKSNDRFLGGTDVELMGIDLSEDNSSDTRVKNVTLYLQACRQNGALKLARNAAADWYYERGR